MIKVIFTLLVCCLAPAIAAKAQNVRVIVEQRQVPVLINKPDNPLLAITCYAHPGTRVQAFEFRFKGTTRISDLKKINLLSGKQLIASVEVKGGKNITLPVDVFLDDTTVFQVTGELQETTDLSHFVDVQCTQVRTDKGNIFPSETSNVRLRTGIAVRDQGQNGIHTCRIPGIATTPQGTLLAIYDARRENSRDLQGDIDIAVSRSTDRGQTWEPVRIALDMKEWGGLPQKFNGVSDAAILVDPRDGRIFIAGLWMHGVLNKDGKWTEGLTKESNNWQHQWRGKGSQPGLSETETSQLLITSSDDDGQSWSSPLNITTINKLPEWWLYAPAPGHGITTADGTLVFPTQGRDKDGATFSNITYSQDGGATWHTSRPAYTNTTECAVAQLPDGTLMLNMRDNRNGQDKGETNGRAVFTTSDWGETWQEHSTSHGALPEPVCMASLLRHDYSRKGKTNTLLLFSNPDSRYDRNNMTVKVSFDGGKSWSTRKVLLDAGRSFGYSCLTSLDENTIGILYESSRAQMVFQRISLDEILSCRE